ncbi:MAG: hypothetical protein U0414_09575 [Polyangiaceae bacterium]
MNRHLFESNGPIVSRTASLRSVTLLGLAIALCAPSLGCGDKSSGTSGSASPSAAPEKSVAARASGPTKLCDDSGARLAPFSERTAEDPFAFAFRLRL